MKNYSILKREMISTDRKQPSDKPEHGRFHGLLTNIFYILFLQQISTSYNNFRINFIKFTHKNIFLEKLIIFLIYKEIYKHFKRPKLMSLPK
jgi:hypothetical protein